MRQEAPAHSPLSSAASSQVEFTVLTPLITKAAKKPSEKWTDERLVKECLAGNEDAWSSLIEKYKALIYSIPVKYGLGAQEAADIFQATCLELLEHLAELREPRALPKWLMQVAHHRCYHWKRLEQRFISRDAEPGIPDQEVPPMAESFLQQLQQEQALREAVAALPPRCQKLIAALFYESPARPYAVVAAELGLAVGSIGLNRRLCIERLRRHLEETGLQ